MAVEPSVTAAVGALDHVVLALGGQPSRERMTRLGVALKPVASAAVRLGGDSGFSGWNRGRPIQLEVAFKVHANDQGLTEHRSGASAGPWRVAEEGRSAGMSRGRKGGARRRKAGSAKGSAYTTSTAKASRRVGATDGKGQWTKAEAAMVAKAPQLIIDATAKDVVAAFGKG